MRVAVSQISSTTDPRSNLELVRDAVRRAEGARVVLLPEATMCRFGVPLGPVAEPLDGPWASAVHEIAVQHDVVVVAGMFTPSGDRVTNTPLVTGPDIHVGVDHKIHLSDGVRVPRVADGRARIEAGDVRDRRRHAGRGDLLRLRFPEPSALWPTKVPPPCRQRVLGRWGRARRSSGSCWCGRVRSTALSCCVRGGGPGVSRRSRGCGADGDRVLDPSPTRSGRWSCSCRSSRPTRSSTWISTPWHGLARCCPRWRTGG